jgi:hypothetical protein
MNDPKTTEKKKSPIPDNKTQLSATQNHRQHSATIF